MIATTLTVRVPIHAADTCGHHSPRSGAPCRRAKGHTGRHTFFWRYAIPGLVREVWGATCQVCHGPVTEDDGAVCRECGA
jgi:hypothetical protein